MERLHRRRDLVGVQVVLEDLHATGVRDGSDGLVRDADREVVRRTRDGVAELVAGLRLAADVVLALVDRDAGGAPYVERVARVHEGFQVLAGRTDQDVRVTGGGVPGSEREAQVVLGLGGRGRERAGAGALLERRSAAALAQARRRAVHDLDQARVGDAADVLVGRADHQVGVAVGVEVDRSQRAAEAVLGLRSAADARSALDDLGRGDPVAVHDADQTGLGGGAHRRLRVGDGDIAVAVAVVVDELRRGHGLREPPLEVVHTALHRAGTGLRGVGAEAATLPGTTVDAEDGDGAALLAEDGAAGVAGAHGRAVHTGDVHAGGVRPVDREAALVHLDRGPLVGGPAEAGAGEGLARGGRGRREGGRGDGGDRLGQPGQHQVTVGAGHETDHRADLARGGGAVGTADEGRGGVLRRARQELLGGGRVVREATGRRQEPVTVDEHGGARALSVAYVEPRGERVGVVGGGVPTTACAEGARKVPETRAAASSPLVTAARGRR